MNPTPSTESVIHALAGLRGRLEQCRLALNIGGADVARRLRAELVGQIDDYLVPRLRAVDAPLLAVVGGSTGAGKSTLVNSLVGAHVSAAGVLRPTTRAPVLVCNPVERRWFEGERVLPRLARTTGAAPPGDERTLHLVADTAVPRGLALLDAPDIDSVVRANRELAEQLLAAADLWLFVTTAARYADAVPWELLHRARARSTAVALVLNRVPREALAEVPEHFAAMLADNGLEQAPTFTVPETALEGGLVPERALAGLRRWLMALAGDASERAALVRKTLEGALDSVEERVAAVAAHVDAQAAAARALRAEVDRSYRAARRDVEESLSGGTLLRGEVLERWQEVIGTGELMQGLQARIGRLRDRVRLALLGETPPVAAVRETLGSNVQAIVVAAAGRAAEDAAAAWRDTAAGAALLDSAERPVERASVGVGDAIAAEVRAWQAHVLNLVRAEGASKRATGRALSLGINAAGAAVMVMVFAHTGGLTGAEIAVAGGTATLSQKLLEALFGDQAVRSLTTKARADLLDRVGAILERDAARFDELLEPHTPGTLEAVHLRAATDAVRAARR